MGHLRPVQAIVFTPDGRGLFTASEDGSVRLWELETGRELRVLCRHDRGAVDLAVSTDGALVAARFRDGMVRVWGRSFSPRTFYSSSESASGQGMVFLPASSVLMLTTGKGLVLWDAAGPEDNPVPLFFEQEIAAIAVSRDGPRVFVAFTGGAVEIFGLAALRGARPRSRPSSMSGWHPPPDTLPALPSPPGALGLSTDGQVLAEGRHGELSLRDTSTWASRTVTSPELLGCQVTALVPLPDSPRSFVVCLQATGGRAGTVRVLQVGGGLEWSWESAARLEARGTVAAYSPDGVWLAVGGSGTSIRLYHLPTRELARTFPGLTAADSFVTDCGGAPFLAVCRSALDVACWDLEHRNLVARARYRMEPRGAMAFAASRGSLFVPALDGSVRMLDVTRGTESSCLAASPNQLAIASMDVTTGGVLAVGHALRHLRLRREDGAVTLWHWSGVGDQALRAGPRGTLTTESHEPEPTHQVAVSGDCLLLASAFAGRVSLLDVQSALSSAPASLPVQVQVLENAVVESLTWSRDGHCLAAGTSTGAIHLWQVATGGFLGHTVVPGPSPAAGARADPGTRPASPEAGASRPDRQRFGAVRIPWPFGPTTSEAGRCTGSGTGPARNLCFSPDGTRLASIHGADGVRLVLLGSGGRGWSQGEGSSARCLHVGTDVRAIAWAGPSELALATREGTLLVDALDLLAAGELRLSDRSWLGAGLAGTTCLRGGFPSDFVIEEGGQCRPWPPQGESPRLTVPPPIDDWVLDWNGTSPRSVSVRNSGSSTAFGVLASLRTAPGGVHLVSEELARLEPRTSGMVGVRLWHGATGSDSPGPLARTCELELSAPGGFTTTVPVQLRLRAPLLTLSSKARLQSAVGSFFETSSQELLLQFHNRGELATGDYSLRVWAGKGDVAAVATGGPAALVDCRGLVTDHLAGRLEPGHSASVTLALTSRVPRDARCLYVEARDPSRAGYQWRMACTLVHPAAGWVQPLLLAALALSTWLLAVRNHPIARKCRDDPGSLRHYELSRLEHVHRVLWLAGRLEPTLENVGLSRDAWDRARRAIRTLEDRTAVFAEATRSELHGEPARLLGGRVLIQQATLPDARSRIDSRTVIVAAGGSRELLECEKALLETLGKSEPPTASGKTRISLVLLATDASSETAESRLSQVLQCRPVFFPPAAQRDLLLSTDSRKLLLEAISSVIPPKDLSLYQTCDGLEDPRNFFGRDGELARATATTLTPFFVYGGRGIGKSSLLKRIASLLEHSPTYEPRYVFLTNERLEPALVRFLATVRRDPSGDLEALLLKPSPDGRVPLWLIDELDDFVAHDAEEGFPRLKLLRGLQAEKRVAIICAGCWELLAQTYDASSPLFNWAEPLEIKSLSEPAARMQATLPMLDIGLEYEDEDLVELILWATGRRPNLISTVCNSLVRLLGPGELTIRRSHVDLALQGDVLGILKRRMALPSLPPQRRFHVEYELAGALFYLALAAPEPPTADDLRSELASRSISVEVSQFNTSLDILERSYLLLSKEGRFHPAVPLMAQQKDDVGSLEKRLASLRAGCGAVN